MDVDISDSDKIARVLTEFRDFLIGSWPTLQAILQSHDWDDDSYFLEEWLDQNWSLLVGRQLLGKGASIQPFCAATNDIRKRKYQFRIRADAPITGTFVSMGSYVKGFSLAPPFDSVKILRDDGIEEILPFSSVSFLMSTLPPTPDSAPATLRG